MNYNQEHAEKFETWRKDRPEVQNTTEKTTLKVGDLVTFTNDNGVIFPGHKILAFDTRECNGRFIYLDYDCFWFPAKESNLTKE